VRTINDVMRLLLRLACLVGLLVLSSVGCGETADSNGGGGAGGLDLCEEVECNDRNDCTEDLCDSTHPRVCVFINEPEDTPCDGENVCDGEGKCVECNDDEHCEDDFNDCSSPYCDEKTCGVTAVADGTPCVGGMCQAAQCALSGSVLPCTEQGIRNAIAAGGGPYTFDCDGPTRVTTEAEITIFKDVVLDGRGDLTVSGNDDHRVFSVLPEVTAKLDGLTLTGGSATPNDVESCGGLLNNGLLTLTSCTVSGNAAAAGGGGLCNFGTLTLIDSAVAGNTAKACAGFFNNGTLTLTNSTVSGNAAAVGGGGLCNSGTLTLSNSVVWGNSADHTGGIENSGTLTLSNCTVSGNVSEEGVGGIFNIGAATVTYSTVSGNTAGGEGADIRNAGTLRMANTLIDGNCIGDDVSTSGGYNIESPDDTCRFDQVSDQVNVSAEGLKLGTLADNGGPTMTHALLPGSVAVDVIPAAMCEVNEDQRSVARPQGDACDVGAFELEEL